MCVHIGVMEDSSNDHYYHAAEDDVKLFTTSQFPRTDWTVIEGIEVLVLSSFSVVKWHLLSGHGVHVVT